MDHFKNIVKCWITIGLIFLYCDEIFEHQVVIDKNVKSLRNIKWLLEKLDKFVEIQNMSELHRTQKIVMFAIEMLLSKLINSNAHFVVRFVEYIEIIVSNLSNIF